MFNVTAKETGDFIGKFSLRKCTSLYQDQVDPLVQC